MACQRAKMNKKEKVKSSSCKYRKKKCLFKMLSTVTKGNIFHCNREDCNSTFHLDCYLSMVGKEKDGEFLKTSDDTNNDNKSWSFVECNATTEKKQNKKNLKMKS